MQNLQMILISPYSDFIWNDQPDRFPLAYIEYGPFSWKDDVGISPAIGVPLQNLGMWRVDLTPQQVAAIRQDSRFFLIANPDAVYNAASIVSWLNNRGFSQHTVSLSDTQNIAFMKIREYFQSFS